MTERFGAPAAASGERARFVVLGMGKLGGDELNAGSDVNLVYLYDTDDGGATSAEGERTSLHEFWTRVARRLTANLDDATEEGRLWRVNLRLRPEGYEGADRELARRGGALLRVLRSTLGARGALARASGRRQSRAR